MLKYVVYMYWISELELPSSTLIQDWSGNLPWSTSAPLTAMQQMNEWHKLMFPKAACSHKAHARGWAMDKWFLFADGPYISDFVTLFPLESYKRGNKEILVCLASEISSKWKVITGERRKREFPFPSFCLWGITTWFVKFYFIFLMACQISWNIHIVW